MEDEEAWPAARLRDCQISRDLSVLALEFNHRHLSHRRDGRVADSTLEPTLERTPQVDAASEDPKGGRIGFEHAASTFHYPSFLTIFREMPQARSEEHTSELQSHHDLVCRLLLEKKKKK